MRDLSGAICSILTKPPTTPTNESTEPISSLLGSQNRTFLKQQN